MENLCTVEGCLSKVRSSGSQYCEKHYYRIRRNGTIGLKRKRNKLIQSNGYVLIPAESHPLTNKHTGYLEYEHRIVYYNKHGAGPFNCHWCGKEVTWNDMHVDHLNDKHDDNSPDNLVSSCPLCNQWRGKDKMIKTIRDKYATWLEYNGQRKTLAEWAKEIGIARTSLQWRVRSGWTMERALCESRGKYGPKALKG